MTNAFSRTLLAGALAPLLAPLFGSGIAQLAYAATPPQVSASASAPVTQLSTVTVVSEQLDAQRNQLSPSTGSSSYTFGPQALADLPQGNATPLNQILLQAPGVVQDSFGDVHVRGDHGNLQYRINGILIPESISGFGQTLDPRMIASMRLLTGALPAQYGLRTAGVVDITTKSGRELGNGGEVGLTAGSHGTLNPFLSDWGSKGRLSWFVTGSFLRNNLGIENPTPSTGAIHDHTDQGTGFGTVSYLLNNDSRISLLSGITNNRFQIPNNPGQAPVYTLAGAPPSAYDSALINENQRELTRYTALSLQGRVGLTHYLLALGQRTSEVEFDPDPQADLIFNGAASKVQRVNRADTLQADFSTPLNDHNMLRYGVYFSRERATQNNSSTVFPADADGNQTSDVPFVIVDNNQLTARTVGAYVQNEWAPTDALAINVGMRFDRISGYLNEQQLSPRIGLVYNPRPDLTLHAGYARYFTPPATELIASTDIAKFQGTTNALPSDSNTDVRAMRSDFYDAGVQWQVNSALTLGLDAYLARSTQLLDEGQFGTALVFSDFNYSEGRNHGLELSANINSGSWNGYLNLTYNVAQGKNVASGQYNFSPDELAYIAQNWIDLDHMQKWTSNGGVSYRFADGTRVGADYLYGTGLRSGFANTGHVPAYIQLNLSASRTFDSGVLGPIKARLTVINALDRSYELRDGTGIGVGAPQYGPRRGVFVTLSKSF
jgi:outer membrane receptor protein involved in Fe transport